MCLMICCISYATLDMTKFTIWWRQFRCNLFVDGFHFLLINNWFHIWLWNSINSFGIATSEHFTIDITCTAHIIWSMDHIICSMKKVIMSNVLPNTWSLQPATPSFSSAQWTSNLHFYLEHIKFIIIKPKICVKILKIGLINFKRPEFTSSFFRTIIFKIAARETNRKSMMPW